MPSFDHSAGIVPPTMLPSLEGGLPIGLLVEDCVCLSGERIRGTVNALLYLVFKVTLDPGSQAPQTCLLSTALPGRNASGGKLVPAAPQLPLLC